MHKMGLVLCSVLILFPLGAAGNREADTGEPEDAKVSAVVSFLQGEATINGQTAEEGESVPIGARIETGSNSFVEITFGRQNIFRVEAETITTVSIGQTDRRIQIEKGSIDAVFERLGMITNNDQFRVETPSVVAGIRGTVFYIKVEQPDTTYLCTCHGTVHQQASDGTVEKDITAYHHKAYRYIKTDTGIHIETGSLIYHDDQSMQRLGEKIGVKIPWGRAE